MLNKRISPQEIYSRILLTWTRIKDDEEEFDDEEFDDEYYDEFNNDEDYFEDEDDNFDYFDD